MLFVEGSQEAYERAIKPYFESEERSLRCRTAQARDPEEALRLVREFKPQLVVLDGSRMPIGVNSGKLAALLTDAKDAPCEVILAEIPSRDFQVGGEPLARLQQLDEAVQKAARRHQLK